jgi:hypothetical protein
MTFLAAVENSAVASWVRDSPSLWAYPTIVFFHTVGMALLVGLNVVIDLRLLGCVRRLPIAPLERFYGLMWTGFWTSAVTGVALLAAHATTRAFDPLFYLKMGCIAIAVAVLVLERRVVFRSPAIAAGELPPASRLLAAASLAAWVASIAAARWMVFLGQAISG